MGIFSWQVERREEMEKETSDDPQNTFLEEAAKVVDNVFKYTVASMEQSYNVFQQYGQTSMLSKIDKYYELTKNIYFRKGTVCKFVNVDYVRSRVLMSAQGRNFYVSDSDFLTCMKPIEPAEVAQETKQSYACQQKANTFRVKTMEEAGIESPMLEEFGGKQGTFRSKTDFDGATYITLDFGHRQNSSAFLVEWLVPLDSGEHTFKDYGMRKSWCDMCGCEGLLDHNTGKYEAEK